MELERKVRAASRSMVDASTVIGGLAIRSRTVGTGSGKKTSHRQSRPRDEVDPKISGPKDKGFMARAEIQEGKMPHVRVANVGKEGG